MGRFDDRHSDALASRNLTWEGDTTIVLNGLEYHCEMEAEVHFPLFNLPEYRLETTVSLFSFEAELGGKPVHDAIIRRELRVKLCEWVENNRELVIRKAR